MLINMRYFLAAFTLGLITTNQSCTGAKKIIGEWETIEMETDTIDQDLDYLEEYNTILEFEKCGHGNMRTIAADSSYYDDYDVRLDWEVKEGRLFIEGGTDYYPFNFDFDYKVTKDNLTLFDLRSDSMDSLEQEKTILELKRR